MRDFLNGIIKVKYPTKVKYKKESVLKIYYREN